MSDEMKCRLSVESDNSHRIEQLTLGAFTESFEIEVPEFSAEQALSAIAKVGVADWTYLDGTTEQTVWAIVRDMVFELRKWGATYDSETERIKIRNHEVGIGRFVEQLAEMIVEQLPNRGS